MEFGVQWYLFLKNKIWVRCKIFYNKFEIIKKIVDELDIVFIDIDKEFFKKEINPLELFPFKKKGHYNVEGYQKIGKAIFDLTKD